MTEVLFQELRPGADGRLQQVQRELVQHFGQPPAREVRDPLSQLIYSMLAVRTPTEVSEQVLRELRARYTTWDELRDAPLGEIERALEAVTFAEQKALHLKATLEQITARVGRLTLDFLAQYRTEKIRSWLQQFPGVGPQVSAAVVNFSTLRRRAISVDAHHLRVTQRLGLTPRADAATTEERLMRLVPPEWTAEQLDEHHQLVKRLGQTICVFENPRCRVCPLAGLCPTAARQRTQT
ncbi:MAG: iron-sulfur cluster loop [Acidobacteriota bacterium]|nr:iron-sulfur cluster loop [Acidobacteriota bacterium]